MTGDVIVGGDFDKELHLGEKSIQSAGHKDLFIADIDATGTVVWARAYGDTAEQQMASLVVDGARQIVLVGQFAGRLQAEGCDVSSAGGSSFAGADAFVMKLSLDGKGIWCKSAGTEHYQEFASSAIDRRRRLRLRGVDVLRHVRVSRRQRGQLPRRLRHRLRVRQARSLRSRTRTSPREFCAGQLAAG